MKTKYFLSVILLVISYISSSQDIEKGIVKGRIIDSKNNESIPFADVSIFGTTNRTLSDKDGNYFFSGVKPGYVQLAVTSIGYKPIVIEPFLVTNSNGVNIDIELDFQTVSLSDVTIKASPFAKKSESPVSLRKISRDEIERNPGSGRDISKVIQAFPGVASTPVQRNDVIVRGGGPAENRFFLDGVEIPNINHFATQGASGGPVGIVNVDFIKEVNLYSGAFPANYGNALSSVLDFKQVTGNKDKLKTKATIGASDLALTLDGPLNKNTTYIFSARRSYLQFLFATLGLPFLPTYNDFQFKTVTKIGSKNELTFVGLGAYDINKLNLDANKTENERFILGYLPENKQWNYTLGVTFKHFRSNGFDNWVVSRNYLNNKSYKYFDNNEDSAKTFDYNSWESENKIRYERSINTDFGLKVLFGANVDLARYYNSTKRKLINGAIFDYQTNISFLKYGFFAQSTKFFFDDRFSVSGGLRLDANTFSDEMINPFDQFSPRISVLYKLNETWNISGNVGRYFEIPPYTTLGFKNQIGELVNKKNGVKYIRSDHVVGGFQYLPEAKTSFSVEGFYKLYRNYPFSVSDSVSISSKGADFGTYGDEEVRSISKGRSYGAELLFQSKSLDGFNAIVSYTWVRSEATDYKNDFIPTGWDNRHILNITGLKSLPRNWDIGFKWRFVGGSPYTPYDLNKSKLADAWDIRGQAYLDYSRFNQSRLKSFHQLDIRVDKAYYFNKWSLMCYLDIQNVYGYKADSQESIVRATDSSVNYLPASGSPAVYDLKTLKADAGGTILPTIGVIVEF